MTPTTDPPIISITRLSAALTLAIGLTAASVATPSVADDADLILNRGIAATLHLPDGEGPFPAVLMLHGLGSTRSEIANIYVDTAQALADRGIASLRIDFRGFGKSDGDTGAFTLDRQNEDADTALTALQKMRQIDPQRIGVLGYSFGAGAALELGAARPKDVKSVVTWSLIGDYRADMLSSMGQKVFDRAAEDGIVGFNLGWRTIVLKQAFFDSLAAHDLHAAARAYPGAFMTINGADDFYLPYAAPLLQSAAGTDKVALVIPDADHIFHVYTPSKSLAGPLIEATVARFDDSL